MNDVQSSHFSLEPVRLDPYSMPSVVSREPELSHRDIFSVIEISLLRPRTLRRIRPVRMPPGGPVIVRRRCIQDTRTTKGKSPVSRPSGDQVQRRFKIMYT